MARTPQNGQLSWPGEPARSPRPHPRWGPGRDREPGRGGALSGRGARGAPLSARSAPLRPPRWAGPGWRDSAGRLVTRLAMPPRAAVKPGVRKQLRHGSRSPRLCPRPPDIGARPQERSWWGARAAARPRPLGAPPAAPGALSFPKTACRPGPSVAENAKATVPSAECHTPDPWGPRPRGLENTSGSSCLERSQGSWGPRPPEPKEFAANAARSQ